MDIVGFSRFYVSYLLFNIGGWVYFAYLQYYASYINIGTCNSYTKELVDAVRIFVGMSMAATSLNVLMATNAIMNYSISNDATGDVSIYNLYCMLGTTVGFLSISGVCSLVIFGITSGMTNIQCENTNAEFGLKLSVYGAIWITFIELFILMTAILLFMYSVLETAKFHLMCTPLFNLYRRYQLRRISMDASANNSNSNNNNNSNNTGTVSTVQKYSVAITMPAQTATYKDEYEHHNNMTCSICYDASINLLLEPCNHICMCDVCYGSLLKKECPICKTQVSSTKKVYFATPGK